MLVGFGVCKYVLSGLLFSSIDFNEQRI